MDVPFQDLPQDFKHALFHGTGAAPISTGWKKTENKRSVAKPFEGLLPEIARMYQNAESDVLRAALSRLMNPQPCVTCGGMRLKPDSLAVKLRAQAKDLNIHDFTALQTRDALLWMRELEVTEQQKAYVGELQREISKRIEFLEQVGPVSYTHLDVYKRQPRASSLASAQAPP